MKNENMWKGKLIQLYCTLDRKQLRELKKWVHSLIHNEHVDVKNLFNFLLSRRRLTPIVVDKERVWTILYPNKNYNDLRLRHIISLALDVLEEFVRYNLYCNDDFYQEKSAAKYLFDRKKSKQAINTWQKAVQAVEKKSINEWYYLHHYELEVLLFEAEEKQIDTTNLSAIVDNARLFFMITTLRYAYIGLTHQNLRKAEYEVPFLEHILTEIETKNYTKYVILQVYYHAYCTLTTPTPLKHFSILRNYLYISNLSFKEKRSILLMCINYAAKQLNTGRTEWIKETFELYQYGLEKGYLIEDDSLGVFTYKNIVTLGLNLKEFDWIEQFIENYSIYLPKENRENYQYHNTAKLAFERGNLDQSMQLLVQVEYDEILLNIDAKAILIKIYYQKDYYDALEALLESFRVYLNRKKVLSYHKKNYTNFILFLRKLLQMPSDKRTVKKIQQEIENTPQLAERKWLLEQL